VNYLKDQPEVLALPDEEYPSWLWTLLDKSELPNDGPGGKADLSSASHLLAQM